MCGTAPAASKTRAVVIHLAQPSICRPGSSFADQSVSGRSGLCHRVMAVHRTLVCAIIPWLLFVMPQGAFPRGAG